MMSSVQLGNKKIFYRWWHRSKVTADPVVLLHAGLASSDAWRRVAGPLGKASDLSVLAYDRCGYDHYNPIPEFPPDFLEREVPTLQALLASLIGGSAHLVGHSDGATIALLCAVQFPTLVRSLVLTGIHSFIEEVNLRSIASLASRCTRGSIPQWLERLHGSRSRALVAAWSCCWLNPARADWDIRDRLRDISIPILLIQGEEDEYGTLEQVGAIKERLPQAQSWIVANCGHAPHADAGPEFIKRVAEFLRAARERRGARSGAPNIPGTGNFEQDGFSKQRATRGLVEASRFNQRSKINETESSVRCLLRGQVEHQTGLPFLEQLCQRLLHETNGRKSSRVSSTRAPLGLMVPTRSLYRPSSKAGSQSGQQARLRSRSGSSCPNRGPSCGTTC